MVAEGITGRAPDWKILFAEELEEIQPIIDAYTLFFTKIVGNEIKGDGVSHQLQHSENNTTQHNATQH